MVQGTMSSAGKSLLVTGLCRIYARRGYRVAPFKAQNMSNNAAVCRDGSEIGRSQYSQALACGIEPTAEMNPILLKPEADSRSQVVLMGHPKVTLPASEYYTQIDDLWPYVTRSLNNLREKHDLVIIEGAGSPAELNLKRGDIVNMAVAKYAQSPVLIAGDINLGGIFAQMLGTLWLLDDEERALVKGLLVNKFRGDSDLFTEGVHILEDRGGVPVIGVIPYIHHHIPEEDAVAVEGGSMGPSSVRGVDIVIIRLPRISNFDDFDPLEMESGVNIRYVESPERLGKPDAIILPGTKSTISDLEWLRQNGLADSIQDFSRNGGAVVGICGGYQMLGTGIQDPNHIESSADHVCGLGVLPVQTVFDGEKATHQVQASIHGEVTWLVELQGESISGYEIHNGCTHGEYSSTWLHIIRRGNFPTSVEDGAISQDGRIWGCYLHGLFDNCTFRRRWLSSLGWKHNLEVVNFDRSNPEFYDEFADQVVAALDMELLDEIVGLQ